MAHQNKNCFILDPTSNHTSVYFLHPTNITQKLTSEVFTGTSYGDWKRPITLALSAKNKLSFVDGSLSEPVATDPNYKAWERVNNMVIGWLIAALEPKTDSSVMYKPQERFEKST